MKKLFLASRSSFLQTSLARDFENLVNKPLEDLSVAIIPTASDVMIKKGSAKRYFQKLGARVITVDLKQQSPSSLEDAFTNVDVIYVGGGNTFYLLYYVKQSGLDKVLPKYINEGIIYAGSSAGAYIACPTIEMADWKHSDKNDIGLSDFSALNEVPFLITAHYEEKIKPFIETGVKKTSLPVIALTDEQAIICVNENYSIIGPGKRHTWNNFPFL